MLLPLPPLLAEDPLPLPTRTVVGTALAEYADRDHELGVPFEATRVPTRDEKTAEPSVVNVYCPTDGGPYSSVSYGILTSCMAGPAPTSATADAVAIAFRVV